MNGQSDSKLFVGGLPWATDDNGLREAFSEFGEVTDAKVIMDRATGRSRGFGFITFANIYFRSITGCIYINYNTLIAFIFY